jgi:hypothetical protein
MVHDGTLDSTAQSSERPVEDPTTVAVYGATKKKDLDKEIITITSSGGIASGYVGHVSVELFLSTYSP